MVEDPDDIRSLTTEGQALLEQARTESSGRSSATLVHGDAQRAVLIGLTAGSSLAEHDAPRAATLQLVLGHARLHETEGEGREWLLEEGDVVVIPQCRHAVDSLSDSVLLLTVAL